ncbi:hypothetical protein GR184_11420 [Bacillus sp. BGMRC0062]|nr:hypothetical protein [Bacillus sp. BGMRC0062]
MGIKIVNSDALDGVLPQGLAQDVMDSFHEYGDCRSCGNVISPGAAVRVFYQQSDPLFSVWIQHAACKPVSAQSNAIMALPVTHRTIAAGVPRTVIPGRGVAFAKNPQSQVVPLMIINPFLEAVDIVRPPDGEYPAGVLEDHIRVTGLRMGLDYSPGDRTAADKHATVARLVGNEVVITDMFSNAYATPCIPPIARVIEEMNGILMIETTHFLVEDVGSAEGTLREFLKHTDELASMWVPLAS